MVQYWPDDILTLSQTTNSIRVFQIERVCRQIFLKLSERREVFQKGRKHQNTVEKGEIARYEQFLLFPKCFQKTRIADT